MAQHTPSKEIARLFDVTQGAPNAPARYNGAPTQGLMAVRRHPATGERHLSLLHWGLIPSWSKDRAIAAKTINARSETAATTRAFEAALPRRRCLVPVDAFYEWTGSGAGKQPHAIAMADRRPFALGGLWEWWKDAASGEEVRSFTVLTAAANETLAPLHHRMPVVVAREHWDGWLACETGIDEVLAARAADGLTHWPVSPRVNSVRHDDAALLDRAEPVMPALL